MLHSSIFVGLELGGILSAFEFYVYKHILLFEEEIIEKGSPTELVYLFHQQYMVDIFTTERIL